LDAEDLAIEAVDDAELRLADARRPFQNSVEHWCEVRDTEACETVIPSFSNSPWMRGAPQRKFARAISPIS
jgi:hypothetical protein